jgi:hypothetical protein
MAALSSSGCMGSVEGTWFSGSMVFLFGSLTFLRSRFPGASKRTETAVLAATTLLFFSLCHFFLAR